MCDHKPKEIFKAVFCHDAILTCRKCGCTICEQGNDRLYGLMPVISLLILLISGSILNIILNAFFANSDVTLWAILSGIILSFLFDLYYIEFHVDYIEL